MRCISVPILLFGEDTMPSGCMMNLRERDIRIARNIPIDRTLVGTVGTVLAKLAVYKILQEITGKTYPRDRRVPEN